MSGLRVATFNLRHGSPAKGSPAWPGQVRRAVAALGPVDVLGLEEVDRRVRRSFWWDQAASGARGQRPAGHRFAPTLRRKEGGHYGNALVWTGDADGEPEVWDLPNPTAREPRNAIVLRRSGVTFVATHLQNDKAVAAQQLDWLLERLASVAGPVVILGDLNLRRPAVTPTFTAAGYELAGGDPTFPATKPRIRIDHVAARGLRIDAVAVPPSRLSDHRPLVVELSTPSGASG